MVICYTPFWRARLLGLKGADSLQPIGTVDGSRSTCGSGQPAHAVATLFMRAAKGRAQDPGTSHILRLVYRRTRVISRGGLEDNSERYGGDGPRRARRARVCSLTGRRPDLRSDGPDV